MPCNPSTLDLHSVQRSRSINLDTHRPTLMSADEPDPRTVAAVRDAVRMVQGQCHSDACNSGRGKCPTPTACVRSEDPEEVHRGPLALILIGFALGCVADALKSPAVQTWLVVLAVPALVCLIALAAVFWPK